MDKTNNEQEVITSTCAMSSGVPTGEVILSTACVYILDRQNNYKQIRALLDCGSQTSFISEGAIKRLGLTTAYADLTLLGISNISSHINKFCQVNIKSMHSSFNTNLKCYVLPVISNTLPSSSIYINSILPKDLQLADPKFNVPGPIEMLIGADLFWTILESNRIALGKNLPILQNTKFGWIVSGQVGASQNKIIACNLSIGQELLRALERFWEVEEFSAKRLLSKDEQECERIFSKSMTRTMDGRFMVNMPLRQDPKSLGESRSQAENRFYALERRLAKNEILRSQYTDFMAEYRNLGHMSIVSDNSSKQMPYYMPHHGVLKDSSLTTRLRVVFDASAPTSNGLSLNNIQFIGPVLQDDLLSIILRFRQYNYVISADIAKMYRQVLINPEQRALQRILWREVPNEPLNTYELNTVTYGQAAASYLAIRCLLHLANEIRESKPNIARIIKHDFYVDDMLTGSDSILEAQEICREVSQVLQRGCFDLRKWCSNQPEVLSNVHHSNLAYDILKFSANEKTQTLGLVWSCQNDKLFYSVDNSSFGSKVTKRSILSATAKIFDPLGLVSPCTIIPKVLMQSLWSEKISWDDPLPERLSTIWVTFENEMSELNSLAINRHVIIKNSTEVELHGFADSSERSYGACVYVRSLNASKCIQVSLLCAKSKVAPIKTISIPRLELCAALLLARLVSKAVKSLRIDFKNVTLWSDSTIVLSWVKTSPNLLKTFSGNRVSAIQTLTDGYQWKYIPTAENPADIVSRGLYPINLRRSDLWWNGPAWLTLDKQSWPNEVPIVDDLPDLKSQAFLTTNSIQLDFPFERFSSFTRMIHTCAYILRFKFNCIKSENQRKGVLSPVEISKATKSLIKICQFQSFPGEIENLLNSKGIRSNNKLLGLTPFLDEDSILRVGGRLKYSDYEFNKRHPIVLPSKHHFTKLLFRYEHERLLHVGPQMLLSAIRDTYWPLSGRNLARHTTRKCMRCFRYNPHSIQPIMGNLPVARVLPSSPFSVVGIDYAGPFLVKDRKGRGCKVTKCYIALFICFSTKALHLELVSSLSTDSFLQALRRFVSRRGKPSKIFSDNGTNFVGAQRELSKILNDRSLETAILEFTASESIEWQFIPPYSPHFGGLWEAGVKSCKYHLKRVLSDTPLLFEELYTICAQIEAILNSRPLSPLTTDPNDLHPLTPAHFIIGKSMLAAPDHDIQDLATNRLSRYQLVQPKMR